MSLTNAYHMEVDLNQNIKVYVILLQNYAISPFYC